MTEQRHIINELNIELKLPTAAGAYELQTLVNDLVKRDFANLVSQYCDELVDPDTLYQLDTIEIDLGKLNQNSIEEDFSKAIKPQLFEALANIIRENAEKFSGDPEGRTGPVTRSRFELLDQFLKTGNLIWWAESKDPNILDRNFEAYINEASAKQVFAWTQKIRQSPVATQRLIRNFSDKSLFLLVEKLSGIPARTLLEQLFQFVGKHFFELPSFKHKTEPLSRNRVISWQFVFYELDKKEIAFRKENLAVNFFLHLASAFKVPPKLVFKDLNDLKKAGRLPEQIFPEDLAPAFNQIREVYKSKSRLKTPREEASGSQPIAFRSVVANLLKLISISASKFIDFFGDQAPVDFPASNQKTIIKTLSDQIDLLRRILDSARNKGEEISRLSISEQEKIKRLRSLLNTPHETQSFLNRLTSSVSKYSENEADQELRKWTRHLHTQVTSLHKDLSESSAPKPGKAKKTSKKPSLKTGEEIYVNNAGLVILAPFYKLFFKHLDLTNEGEFKSEEARFKAMHLLHFLSYGEEDTLEFLLPLNKIICGWDVSDPVEIDSVLSKEDKEECANLIQAAVGHAPVFKNISVDGFRGSFILRNGIISTRDRNWLLQVEKQSYDVVLEQIPWSYKILKLPWMDKLMYVEW